MPTYEYKCDGCGILDEIICSANDAEKIRWDNGEICHYYGAAHLCGTFRRVFSFNTGPIFQPHLNGTTGTYVSSRAEFNDELKRISERETLRTGIDSTITPIDHQEQVKMFRDKHGDVGLKEQHDGQVARGEKESRGKFVHPIT